MTLRQTTRLSQFADSLLQADPTGNTSAIEGQISDAARPTIGGVLSSLDTASDQVAGQFNTAEGTIERQQRAIGAPSSASEDRVQRRRIGLSRALSQVDARNREVGNVRRRADIARSSAGNLRDIVEGQRLQLQQQAAQSESARFQRYQSDLAAHKSKKLAGLGTAAAIGLSFIPGGAFLAPAAAGAVQAAG